MNFRKVRFDDNRLLLGILYVSAGLTLLLLSYRVLLLVVDHFPCLYNRH